VCLVQAEIDENFFLYGLWIVVQERRHIGIAPEEPKGVTVDELDGITAWLRDPANR